MPLLDEPVCMLESLKFLAVLERVGQETDLREGQGTRNTGRVHCVKPEPTYPLPAAAEISAKRRGRFAVRLGGLTPDFLGCHPV